MSIGGSNMTSSFRKSLSAPGLISAVFQKFCKVPEPRQFTKPTRIPLRDHLMSGLAVFGLKCPSLLDYDRKRSDPATKHNLRTLYHVENPPCDSYLAERLDMVNPQNLRPGYKKIFSLLQRGNGLKEFEYMNGHVLISVDGTGHFSSSKVSCPQCCHKVHSNGKTTFYHQMLAACIVHPDKRNVIPFCPEAIMNQDGNTTNDCEQNACKRFLENFRREHPHLKAILLEDGLSSNAPNIRMIQKHKLSYILVAKSSDHAYLFKQLEDSAKTTYYEVRTEDGSYHQFRYLNKAYLNKSHKDLKVNVLEYRCTNSKGKEYHCAWVTDFVLSDSNVLKIATAGRARWKIENETFNTLKNLGYNFEHNYGHGKQYLATVLSMLMMLAFLIDQVQEVCCFVFQRCKQSVGTYRGLWETMRTLFRFIKFSNWETFYGVILKDKVLTLDTS